MDSTNWFSTNLFHNSRTGVRTCTPKLTILSLEKYDRSSANLWCRTYVLYEKMTKGVVISSMVKSSEMLPQHRELVETGIKDIFSLVIRSPKRTKDSIYCVHWTGTVNGRRQAFTNLLTDQHRLYF